MAKLTNEQLNIIANVIDNRLEVKRKEWFDKHYLSVREKVLSELLPKFKSYISYIDNLYKDIEILKSELFDIKEEAKKFCTNNKIACSRFTDYKYVPSSDRHYNFEEIIENTVKQLIPENNVPTFNQIKSDIIIESINGGKDIIEMLMSKYNGEC